MALETVFANPPPLVGLGNKETEKGEYESLVQDLPLDNPEDLEDGEILDEGAEDDEEEEEEEEDRKQEELEERRGIEEKIRYTEKENTEQYDLKERREDRREKEEKRKEEKKEKEVALDEKMLENKVHFFSQNFFQKHSPKNSAKQENEKDALVPVQGEEDKEDRKKKKKKKKHRHRDSDDEDDASEKKKKKPRYIDYDQVEDDEMIFMRGGSPLPRMGPGSPGYHQSPPYGSPGRSSPCFRGRSRSPLGPYDSPYDSYDSEFEQRSPSPRRGRGQGKKRGVGRDSRGPDAKRSKRDTKGRDGQRRKREPGKEDQICVFYMQGKCQKGGECPYSHDAVPPRKVELCKFYLMDCCAKKEKCLYMHKDFPCKFYHTGAKCKSGDKCKFSHSGLTDTTRAILLKHLETAPKEILGEFPRLTREGAAALVLSTEAKNKGWIDENTKIPSLFDVEVKLPGIIGEGDGKFNSRHKKSPKKEKDKERNRDKERERDRDKDKEKDRERDKGKDKERERDREKEKEEKPRLKFYQDTLPESEEDMEVQREDDDDDADDEKRLHDGGGDTGSQERKKESLDEQKAGSQDSGDGLAVPLHLPKKQRELFMRIQQQQRETENNPEVGLEDEEEDGIRDEGWYSSDEEGEDVGSLANVLKNLSSQTVCRSESDVIEEKLSKKSQPKSESNSNLNSLLEGLKYSDLSKINISDDVAKVLSALRSQSSDVGSENPAASEAAALGDTKMQSSNDSGSQCDAAKQPSRDPRLSSRDPRDPRNRAIKQELTETSTRELQESRKTWGGQVSHDNRDSWDNREMRDPRENRDPRESRDPRDPRNREMKSHDSRNRKTVDIDLRQGPAPVKEELQLHNRDTDLRNVFRDTDLRSLSDCESSLLSSMDLKSDTNVLTLPFKPVPDHTPATEIDASITSHPPMLYRVHTVTLSKPDYRKMKLNFSNSQLQSDPRLRKLARHAAGSEKPYKQSDMMHGPRGIKREHSLSDHRIPKSPDSNDSQTCQRSSHGDLRNTRSNSHNSSSDVPTSCIDLQEHHTDSHSHSGPVDPRLSRSISLEDPRAQRSDPGIQEGRADPRLQRLDSRGEQNVDPRTKRLDQTGPVNPRDPRAHGMNQPGNPRMLQRQDIFSPNMSPSVKVINQGLTVDSANTGLGLLGPAPVGFGAFNSQHIKGPGMMGQGGGFCNQHPEMMSFGQDFGGEGYIPEGGNFFPEGQVQEEDFFNSGSDWNPGVPKPRGRGTGRGVGWNRGKGWPRGVGSWNSNWNREDEGCEQEQCFEERGLKFPQGRHDRGGRGRGEVEKSCDPRFGEEGRGRRGEEAGHLAKDNRGQKALNERDCRDQSYTPPLSDMFREKDPTASPFC